MNRKSLIRSLWILLLVCLMLPTSIPSPSSAADDLPYLELNRPDRGKVFAITWSPDGQYIAVGTEQGLWIYTDTFADVTHADDNPIHALVWSPDGKTIAAGYFGKEAKDPLEHTYNYLIEGGGLRLWSVQQVAGATKLTVAATLLNDGSVYCIKFNKDGSRFALLLEAAHNYGEDLYASNKLQIYTTSARQLTFESEPINILVRVQDDNITQFANALDWNTNDQLTVMYKLDSEPNKKSFSIVDAAKNQIVVDSSYFDSDSLSGWPTAIEWNDDGTQVALSAIGDPTGLSNGGINICDADNTNSTLCIGSLMDDERFSATDTQTLAWRPNHPQLAYSQGTAIHLWDARTQIIVLLDAAYANVTMLTWNPAGTKLLSAGSDYVVRLWSRFESYQAPDPQPIQTVELPPLHETYTSTIISPDAQWIADINNSTDHKNNRVDVISVQDGSTRVSFPFSTYIDDEYWSPDGTMLAIVISLPEGGHKIEIWSVESGNLVLDVGGIGDFAWRPDSKAYARSYWGDNGTGGIFSNYQEIRVYAVPSKELIQTSLRDEHWQDGLVLQRSELIHHRFDVAQWSPDGRYIALNDSLEGGLYDGISVLLWDTQLNVIAGELFTRRTFFVGSGGFAQICGWSPDGKTAIANGKGNTYLYRLTPESDKLSVDLIWHPQLSIQADDASRFSGIAYSPDGRYLFYSGIVIDTHTGWPVFKFRNTTLDYIGYRWVGDTLTGFDLGDENTHGTAVSVRTRDFLPQ